MTRDLAQRLLRGRWLPLTILVLVGAGLMIGLGSWQLGRLAGRRAANEVIAQRLAEPPLPLSAEVAQGLDPDALAFRRVTARGTWDYQHEIVVRFTSFNGQPGVQVLTPLRLAGGDDAVLVDRGWIPYQGAGQEERRAYQGQGGSVVEVEGLFHQSQLPGRQHLAAEGQGRIDAWSRVDLPAIGRQVPYRLLPYWIERLPAADGSPGPPFPDGPPRLDEGSHLSYTIQWWAFAGILVGGYLALAAHPPARRAVRGPWPQPRSQSPRPRPTRTR